MKLFFVLVISCWAVASLAQPKVKLKVYSSDCVFGGPFDWFVQVTLYHMPDSTKVFTSLRSEYPGEVIDVAELMPGKYKAVYYNRMRQQLTREIVLGLRDTAIGFCVDSLLAYPQNTLARFEDKDSLVMSCVIAGCFHYSKEKIVVTRKGGNYYADLFVIEPVEMRESHYRDSITLIKSVSLNNKQLEAFLHFENELNLLDNDYSCTSSITFDINSPYLNIQKEDATCRWGGYGILRYVWFGKTKEEVEEE